MPSPAKRLSPALTERVLGRLGLSYWPPATVEGLTAVYRSWCHAVPYDNVLKLISLQRHAACRLPGDDPLDFFEGWLRYGAGGTCWAGNGALYALLSTLGFEPFRGVATILARPNTPPNHGTVVVVCEGKHYVVDATILHDEPLELAASGMPDAVVHAAWGVRSSWREGRWIIRWRPLHILAGVDCRIEHLDGTARIFRQFHEQTRAWGPFNYALYARRNRGTGVIGTAFGNRIEIDAAGNVSKFALAAEERVKFLVEELGVDEELAHEVPNDAPTPPPPYARATAVGRGTPPENPHCD